MKNKLQKPAIQTLMKREKIIETPDMLIKYTR
jgi:hypothetical protein